MVLTPDDTLQTTLNTINAATRTLFPLPKRCGSVALYLTEELLDQLMGRLFALVDSSGQEENALFFRTFILKHAESYYGCACAYIRRLLFTQVGNDSSVNTLSLEEQQLLGVVGMVTCCPIATPTTSVLWEMESHQSWPRTHVPTNKELFQACWACVLEQLGNQQPVSQCHLELTFPKLFEETHVFSEMFRAFDTVISTSPMTQSTRFVITKLQVNDAQRLSRLESHVGEFDRKENARVKSREGQSSTGLVKLVFSNQSCFIATLRNAYPDPASPPFLHVLSSFSRVP
jgi:hypothetical protein